MSFLAKSESSCGTSTVMQDYTAEDHRRRFENIDSCRNSIRSCMREHLVTNYLPGQCVYNMCEYPSHEMWEPGECD